MAAITHVILILSASANVAFTQNPRIEVQEGMLVGKTVLFHEEEYINVTKNVDMFLGVPFADPPGCFEAPKSKTPWSGEWDATSHRAACLQTPVASFYFPDFMDEDCLYLNVFAPHPKPENAAVMVWIHGGGFASGTAMTYDYYGVPLVAVGDVIVVTINYRLGVLGFLSTDDDEAPGNYGMLDQVTAMRWVKNNIKAFGGDSKQITVFGESAGAASVSFHLLSKLSEGLFHQAILQSGSAFSNFAFRPDRKAERQYAETVGIEMGCNASSSSELVQCLKQVNARQLRAVADRVNSLPAVLCISSFLEDTPYNLYARGEYQHVPLLTGFNLDEGTIRVYGENIAYVGSETPPPINRSAFEESVKASSARYGLDDPVLQASILQEYTDWEVADDPRADLFHELVDFHGDFDFICPTNALARIHAEGGSTVYQYFMTHRPSMSYLQYGSLLPATPWLGASHLEDLTFVWGVPFIQELDDIHGYNLTREEKTLSVRVMTMWTNFAKTGIPHEDWPPFTLPYLRYQELSPAMRVGRAARARQCHFWSPYLRSLKTYTDGFKGDFDDWKNGYTAWKGDLAEWQNTFEDYNSNTPCS